MAHNRICAIAPMTKTIALFGGSFNPPGTHHRAIAERLAAEFDEVVVVPCGPRPDKPVTNDLDPVYRATMVDMTFQGLPKVRVELFDLEASTFTPNWQLDERFRSEGRIWHLVGADLIQGGRDGNSPIQREWYNGRQLWQKARFIVTRSPGLELADADLPPHSRVLDGSFEGRSSAVRDAAFRRRSIAGMVTQAVERYIQRHDLYRGTRPLRTTRMRLGGPRYVVFDDRSPDAARLANELGPSCEGDPEVIVVVGGDGTMLRAIRQHWRRRVPFCGINVGHRGFLLNDASAEALLQKELVLQQLPLLWVLTQNLEDQQHEALAFNDAWVERATGQTAWISVEINDRERLRQLVADGALVSTAAGSTGYARAMGGTSLPPGTPALLLVGSNVLRPEGWKPTVLPLDATVRLTTLDPDKRPLVCYIDGVSQGSVRSMTARLSKIAAVELAFDPERDPAEKLAQIQFPPPGP
jgi:NAD+ kinase